MAARDSSKICSFNLQTSLQAVVRLIAVLTILTPCSAGFARNLPGVALECPSSVLRPSIPFELRIIVSWKGAFDSHVIVPPEPVLPEGITLRSSSFETSVSDFHYQLTYRFMLTAHQTGSFTIHPVTLLCWSRNSSTELSLLTNECTITVEPAAPISQKNILAIAAAIMLAGITAFLYLLKKRIPRSPLPAQPASKTKNSLVQQCRRERLQGDYEAFYTTALHAAHRLMPADNALHSRIAAGLERERFSGKQSSAEDADYVLRQLERALTRIEQL